MQIELAKPEYELLVKRQYALVLANTAARFAADKFTGEQAAFTDVVASIVARVDSTVEVTDGEIQIAKVDGKFILTIPDKLKPSSPAAG